MRDHRGIIFASLYTIIKNKTGDIFLSGQNQCHITGVKKSYFCHTFHLRPKKVFWWAGGWQGGWKVTLVSVCVHFWTFRHMDTKWTQSLTKKHNNSYSLPNSIEKKAEQKLNLPKLMGDEILKSLHLLECNGDTWWQTIDISILKL